MKKSKVFFLFILSVIVFVITGIAVTWYSHAILKEDRKIIAVAEVYSALDKIRLNLRAMIIAHNYYLLTAGKNYLIDYSSAKDKLQSDITHFRTTEYELFISADAIDSIEKRIADEVYIMDTFIASYNRNTQTRLEPVINEKAYILLKEIRLLAEDHSGTLELVQNRYKAKIEKDVFYISIILIVGFCIGLIIILYTFYRLIAENRARRQSEKATLQYSEELKQLNWTKDVFFSIIAHDLRGPMTSLINIFEILSDAVEKKDFSKLKEYILALEVSTQRTNNLLQNLLEWSRLQTGRLQVSPEYFNIKDIIKENCDLFHETARQKNISINCQTLDVVVYADRNMINAVIRNLIGNAVKFTDEGEISVETKIQDNVVVIEVSDTGFGLTEADRAKLFKIEEDVRLIGSGKGKGSGLGLILCKNFVELNNGRIWAESVAGKGSRFYFTIPAGSNI